MSKQINCGTCFHSTMVPAADGVLRLQCRRYPPLCVVVPAATNQGTAFQVVAIHPVVERGNACGEWHETPDPPQ